VEAIGDGVGEPEGVCPAVAGRSGTGGERRRWSSAPVALGAGAD